MQQAASCTKKEVSEELPEYTWELRAKVQKMVATEFNRKTLENSLPFPLLPEPKGFFGWVVAVLRW